MNDPKIAKKAAAKKAQPNAKSSTAPPGDAADSLEAIANDAAEFVGSYLKEMAATYSSSLSSIQAGTYKVENVWADGIKMWSSYMSSMGKAVELGSRAAKVQTTKPTEPS